LQTFVATNIFWYIPDLNTNHPLTPSCQPRIVTLLENMQQKTATQRHQMNRSTSCPKTQKTEAVIGVNW